jgi:hypothetical protein
VLLETLAKRNIAGRRKDWKEAADTGWSNFGSDDYERVIQLIRLSMAGDALWKVEEHWQGNQ